MTTAKLERLRVVLDTNVYFSALTYPQGVPFQIWQKAIRQDFVLIVSPAIIREVADVLRNKDGWHEAAIVVAVKLMAKVGDVVVPRISLQVVAGDPDDDRILECAITGKADLIVSGDRHLRRLKSFEGIGIVRPIDFLRIYGK
jgi:uncharacterized protein